ncbi:unnamed protein product [Arctia plantaginis]|uniref:Uncharacterized protein n=1 Tax=Arctia plantaginis TaxID=874455 RepID=A0A8S0ZX94_ARCPL|nr:unnamed protein product [Arctia plantaginis]
MIKVHQPRLKEVNIANYMKNRTKNSRNIIDEVLDGEMSEGALIALLSDNTGMFTEKSRFNDADSSDLTEPPAIKVRRHQLTESGGLCAF